MPAALLAVLLATSPAATGPAAPLPARCTRPGAEKVDARRSLRVRKLGDMPSAKQILGVYREVGGCPTPVVVREEVGTPERLTPRP